MPWDIIITGIISLVSGGGIMQLINWKASKRKANLENDATAIDTLKDVISEIRIQNDNFQQINQKRESELGQLRCQLIDKEKDLSIIGSYVCKHLGCKFRSPCREQADKWLKDLKDGKATVDYEPINISK